MASIILMKSDEFMKSFVKKFDYRKFNIILISDDIKTDHDYKNVLALKKLLPPTKALACMMNGNDWDGYYEKYFRYLSKPDIEIFLTIIAKLAIAENTNVILMCSPNEDEMKYLKAIKEYLEAIYNVKVYSYKKFKDNPSKCNSAIEKKKTLKVIAKKIELTAKQGVSPELDPESVKGRLKHMSKESLIKFAKRYDIKIKKDMSKSDIIKKLKKNIR